MKSAFKILLASAILFALLPSFALPPATSAAPPADEIPADWWRQVQADIRNSEYNVTWQTQTYLADVPAAYHAANRAQNLRAYFTEDGVRVIPRTGDAGWELGLSVDNTGAAELAAQERRIAYRRGALGETFANTEAGLRHEIALNGATTLDLALSGNLTPRIAAGGQSVEFLTASGVPVLRYGDFSVTGANGQDLPIQVSLHDATHLHFTFHVSRFTSHASRLTFHALLTALHNTADWSAESNYSDAQFGFAVAGAGDVNGDGFSDVIVGARYYDNGEDNEGRAFVYHGSAAGLSAEANWNAEINLADAQFGQAVASAGDVNNDGFSDVIIGAPNYTNDESQEGAAFVYHGSAAGLGANSAWRYESDQGGAHLGAAVSSSGYVNNSPYTGVIVGAPDYDGGQSLEGRVFVFYGAESGLNETPNWSKTGGQSDASFGASVSSAGDVNGDGYADIIIGAPNYDNETIVNAGAAFLYPGAYDSIGASAIWSVVYNQADAHFGATVTLAGDTNGDGHSDVLVGAPDYTNGENGNAGAVYIYLGANAGLMPIAEWHIEGDAPNLKLGDAAALAGDVDGDGYADVIVGAPGYSNSETREGMAFIYMGASDGIAAAALNWDPQINQAGASFGMAVAGAGDVNGDGFSDVIVGAPGYSHGQTNEGGAFVYYGHADPPNQTHNWTATGINGEGFGTAVSTAGDINGDGYADVVVGAPQYDGGQANEGRILIYLGSTNGLASSAIRTYEIDQTDANFGKALSSAGDTNGDGYDDIVVGAPYYTYGQNNEGRAYVFWGNPSVDLNSSWHAEVNSAEATLGLSVGCAGDVNGDGFSDIIVGSPRYYNSGQTFEGAAWIWSGGWPITPTAQTGGTGNAYWHVESGIVGRELGNTVDTAGDVNGDGYSDVIVGALNYDHGEDNEGVAYLYLGAPDEMMSDTPIWQGEGNQDDARYSASLGTAGDVNGDGYSDFIVGAPQASHDEEQEGLVYLYYGAAGIPNRIADEILEINQVQAHFGASVSIAGDVNGDGYSDIIVGAPLYYPAVTNYYGSAFVYYGSATGVSATPDWSKRPDTPGLEFGIVSAAGDVNGDGFGDVIIGAKYGDTVYAFYGNGGGAPLRPGQMQIDGATNLAPLGRVNSQNSVQVHLEGKSPLGYNDLKLEWQAAPLGQAFGDSGTVSGVYPTWTEPGTTLTQIITGLASSASYHWRVRLRYRAGNLLNAPASRWIHMPRNGWLETDFQTAPGALGDVTATNDSPTTLWDSTTLTGTSNSTYVSYDWDFGDGQTGSGKVVTNTYADVGHYEAELTVSNGISTVVATTEVAILDVPIDGLVLVNNSPSLAGQTTFFTASVAAGTGVTYTWDFGDDSSIVVSDVDDTVQHEYANSGNYTATVTARNTAGSASAASPVSITDAPIAGLTLVNDGPTPLDDATTLTASVTEGSNIVYDWNFGDGELLSDGGAVVQHIYPDMGDYTAIVTATNSFNTMSADTLITINPQQPVSGLLAFNDSPTDFDSPTTLSATVEAGSGVTYTWAFGDGAFFYPQNWPDSGKVVTHTYPNVSAFTATVTATNRSGEITATTIITIEEVPIDAAIAGNDSPTALGSVTMLSATVTAGSHVTYAWDLGDGQAATGATVMHTYLDVGVFTATVTATNPLNDAIATTTVTIIPVWHIYLPLIMRDFAAP